jgi:cytochrome P450
MQLSPALKHQLEPLIPHLDLVRPPGPPGEGFMGIMETFRKDPLGSLERCAHAYGDVAFMRLAWSGMYLINHPALAEEILLNQQSKFIKDSVTRALRFSLGDGLLSSDGEHWKKQRKLIAPSMKRRQIASYADAMVDSAHNHLDALTAGARDVHFDMMSLALDIAARTMFGADVDPADGRHIGEVIEIVMEDFILEARTWRRVVPMWIPSPRRKRIQRSIHEVDKLLYGIIGAARASGERGDNLLSILLDARDEDGKAMSDQQVRDEAVTMFVAGHETTALALSYMLYVLGGRPDLLTWLREEVDAVLGARRATFEDTLKLERVNAMVSETLRLYPPAWIIGRQATEECQIGGYTIPSGSQVLISQWLLHRDARWFDDPLAFRPQRWMDGLKERLPRFVYFPFGGGARTCIGNHFALMEAVLVLATMIQRLDIQEVQGFALELMPSITLRPVHGVKVHLAPRA